jgi:hypothetical protein
LLEKLKEAGSIEFAGFQTEHKAPIPQAAYGHFALQVGY